MGNTFFFQWEPALMIFLQQFMTPVLTKIFSLISAIGEEYLMIVVFAVVYFCIDKKKGEYIAVTVIASGAWNAEIKNIFMRRRPYFDNHDIACLKPVEKNADLYDISAQGYSFPSGHSSNSTVMFGSLAYAFRKKPLIIIAVVLPLLVGISRILLGVHYPTDVLAGWALGIMTVFVIGALQKHIKRKWLFYLIVLATMLPGIFYCHTTDYFTMLGLGIGFFAGNLLENRFVDFKVTRNPVRALLRLIGTVGIYLGLNAALKLPFSTEFLESATPACYAVRVLRYGIIIFILSFLYPMLFKVGDRIEANIKNNSRRNRNAN